VLQLADMRQALVNEAERLDRDIALYLPFGDFDVSLPARLAGQGLRVQLFRDPTDTTFIEADGVLIQEFGADDKFTYGVMIGPGELPEGCEALVPPEASVSVLRERLAKALERAAHIADRLKKNAGIAAELKAETVRLADESAFAVAADAMRAEGTVAWITGWLPAEAADTLRETAAEHHWGVLLRDPEPGELPPTLSARRASSAPCSRSSAPSASRPPITRRTSASSSSAFSASFSPCSSATAATAR
jgi:V/A-type H+-transporting ATPase subunit I